MTPAHESLLNHASVIGATCCHPMSGRYCEVGRELWVEDKAQFIAGLGSRHEREYWIGELRAVDPKNALKVGVRAAEIEREAGRRT
mgnify:FL=1